MAAKKTTTTTRTVTKRSAPVRKSTPLSVAKVNVRPTDRGNNAEISKSNGFRLKKSHIIGALGLILLISLLYAARSVFVAALVNGQPVTRLSLVKELEKTGGKQALNSLVTKTLIFQEARKQNVTVNEQEVDAEIKKIEKNLSQQGQKLDQVLTLQGMTKDGLIEQIRIQKMIEKMVGKDIKISDKEINDYIAANKESFPAETPEAQVKTQVRDQLQQQKLNEKVQSWLDKLQKSANINYFVDYK